MKKNFLFVLGIFILMLIMINMSVSSSTIYGKEASKLHPETRKQLNDPNYQRIVLPEELENEIESKKGYSFIFFSPTCGHCKRTTPVIGKINNEM